MIGPPPSRPRPLDARAALLAITAFGALLRFAYLGDALADIDETWTWYSLELAKSGGFWQVLGVGVEGPLFAGLNYVVASIWGPSLPALRIPQALFGTLAIPLAFALFGRLHSPRLGLAAAALCATSPFLVFYSRHARPYSQLLFFALLWVLVDERTRVGPSRRRRLALAASAGLAVATHYYALVFLGVVWLLRGASHLVAGRRAAWRAEVRDGLVTLAALAPLLALFVIQLSALSMPYWQQAPLGLAAVWVEQLLLLGSSLVRGEESSGFNTLIAALGLLPFAWAFWKDPRELFERPLLWIGPAMPLLVTGLLGSRYVFYPRGFIPAVPFLLAGWALYTAQLPAGRWRRAYVAVLGLPFLVSSHAVATSDPDHGFLRGREVMPEIVARARALDAEYDLLVVHHWWITQYVAFFYPEPARVRGLGMWDRRVAARESELTAILRDVALLPSDARILLLRNDLATSHVDPDDAVVAALRAERPLLRELPCREQPQRGESLLCDRMFLFGAERPPDAAAPGAP